MDSLSNELEQQCSCGHSHSSAAEHHTNSFAESGSGDAFCPEHPLSTPSPTSFPQTTDLLHDSETSTSTLTFDLPISYRGTVLHVPVTHMEPLGELKSRLEEMTGIEPSNQKLSAKGKLLTADKDNIALHELFGLAAGGAPDPKSLPKLMLIGTSSRTIAEIQEEGRKIQATLANRKKWVATSADVSKRDLRTLASEPSSGHTFLNIAVLPSPPYPNPNGAINLLEKIRSDPAIRHVMQAHDWKVGILTELSPFERTILGFNKNKGMEISLRLRTDNLEGFRSYGSIRKVLIHELTHMEISEHDTSFNELNSKLTKQVLAYERKMREEGRTLGGVEYDYGDAESLTEGGEMIDSHGYEGSAAAGLKAEAGGMRSEEWRERERTMAPRELLRLATEQRLNKGAQGRGEGGSGGT